MNNNSDFWTSCSSMEGSLGIPHLVIPSIVDEISERAFIAREEIEMVTICEGVMSIGESAFGYCSNLKKVKIPASVREIGNEAFRECGNLEHFDVDPDNDTYCSIDGVLFRKNPCVLIQFPAQRTGRTYIVPQGVEEIGPAAFCRCGFLEKVVLPESLRVIGSCSFMACDSLQTMCCGDDIESIGEYAFVGCSSLEQLTLPVGLDSLPMGLVSGCKSLCDVVVPPSARMIGSNAFECCEQIRSVSIPLAVESIHPDSFRSCLNLNRIEVAVDNPSYCAIDGVLYTKDKKILVKVPPCCERGHFVVPDFVEEIDDFAFDSCQNLSHVTLPNSIRRIGYCAFSGCIRLSSFRIPKSVEWIGSSTQIDNGEIEDDEDFMPSELTNVFDGCSSLAEIEVDKENPKFCSRDSVLFSKDMSEILFFPQGSKLGSYSIPDGVRRIGSGTFADCVNLLQVEIPPSVRIIDNFAFSNCIGLSKVAIPSSVERESYTAFWDCLATIVRLRDC